MSIRKSLAAAIVAVAAAAFADDAIDLSSVLGDRGEIEMPDPRPSPPPIKQAKGVRPKTSIKLAPNAREVQKLIDNGTRDDHPAVIIARKALEKAGKAMTDAR